MIYSPIHLIVDIGNTKIDTRWTKLWKTICKDQECLCLELNKSVFI